MERRCEYGVYDEPEEMGLNIVYSTKLSDKYRASIHTYLLHQ